MFLVGRVKKFLDRKSLLGRIMARQFVVAAFFSLGAFAYALIFNASMSYMGNKDDAAASFVIKNFWDVILFTQVKILLTYLLFFTLLGLVCGLFIYSIMLMLGRDTTSRRYKWGAVGVPGLFFLHIWGWKVLQYPQVFSRTLFEKGGLRRGLQIFFTDVLGPGYYNVVLVLFLALFTGSALYVLIKNGRLKRFWDWAVLFVRRPVGAVLVGGTTLVILLFSLFGEVSAKGKRYNLLILASDALRPDRLSLHGYKRKTSPQIDALMQRGTSFTRTFIEVPRTFPSWVSLLCGQYSFTHGIRHMFPTIADRKKEFPSLASHLKKYGYGTAVVSDFAGDIFPRIKLGFDIVKAPYMNFDALLLQGNLEIHTFLFPFIINPLGRRLYPVLREFAQLPDGRMLAQDAKQVIKKLSSKGNFFVTLFFSTTHFPYANCYPYYKTYADPDYNGEYKYYKQQVVLANKKKKISLQDIKQVNALYDGGVKAFDDSCASVLSYLRNTGLDKNTIVVVLADHGENLYEKGMGMGHGEHLRGDYSTRIPFLVYHPGFQKKSLQKIGSVVRVIDIAPTLSSLLKTGFDKRWQGDDCSYWITGAGKKPSRRFAYSETGIWFSDRGDHFFQKQRVMYPDITKIYYLDFDNNREIVINQKYASLVTLAKHRSIRTKRYRLIYIPTRQGVMYELYDMKYDPDCRDNIAKRKPALVAKLKRKLFGLVRSSKKEELLNQFILPSAK